MSNDGAEMQMTRPTDSWSQNLQGEFGILRQIIPSSSTIEIGPNGGLFIKVAPCVLQKEYMRNIVLFASEAFLDRDAKILGDLVVISPPIKEETK